jgi:hypothetical protein
MLAPSRTYFTGRRDMHKNGRETGLEDAYLRSERDIVPSLELNGNYQLNELLIRRVKRQIIVFIRQIYRVISCDGLVHCRNNIVTKNQHR